MKQAKDKFLLELPKQPKKTIAEYVAANGILIPKIYPSLRAALATRKPFIIRSENPQDYFGASGVSDSHLVDARQLDAAAKVVDLVLDPAVIENPTSRKELYYPFFGARGKQLQLSTLLAKYLFVSPNQNVFEKSLTRNDSSKSTPIKLWDLLKFSEKHFDADTTYTYWEALGGYNRAIIADSAVPGRYHLFTRWTTEQLEDTSLPEEKRFFSDYTIVESGKIVRSYSLPNEMTADIPGIVEMYEKVRHLPKFDPQQAPLIEFQTVKGKNYFLQYMLTRKFEPSPFTLTRAPEPGEVEADFVRGATPPQGVVVNATFSFGPEKHFQLHASEEASWNLHYQSHFTEARARKLRASFTDEFDRIGFKSFCPSHCNRSVLFKPEVSVGIEFDSVVPTEDYEKLITLHRDKDTAPMVRVRVISDGKKAYIKYLGPVSVEPQTANRE